MADVITASEARIFIGPAVTEAQADSLAEFEALTPWTEIELVESISDFGDEASDVSFAALKDGRMRHAKGVRDAGTATVVVAHDPLDDGQAAMAAAQATNNNYAIKVILPDAPTELYSNTIKYFRALVRSDKQGQLVSDQVVKVTYMLGINSEVFVDPAALI